MLLNKLNTKVWALCLTGLLSQVTLADVDTSEYGAWNDVLTAAEARGRFDWMNRCYKDLLVETWDRMYDPTLIISADEKVDQLRQAWLYKDGQPKAHPNYVTFGDNDHRNPRDWYAGISNSETCRTIPVDYRMIGLMTSFDMKRYCAIESQSFEYEWIAKVEFGTQISESQGRNYTNFSGRVLKATKGQDYDIKLTPGFSEDPFGQTWHVWVDWNGDGDFTDANELLFEDTARTTLTKSITVPADAATGFTKMRITMDVLGGKNDPCANTQYGEVEDYTLLIN